MNLKNLTPNSAAIVGFLFSLPFVIINFIVVRQIEPIYTILDSNSAIRNNPIFPLLLLSLFPIGAFISIYPMLKKGRRKFYLLNSILFVVLITAFLLLSISFGEELYKCEVLKIPRCD